ncbi:hypothetical protein FJ251_05865 [bacterium]|nr:hypothetical protein [bacterium]
MDLQAIVPDAHVEAVFVAVRQALETLSPIARSYRLPEPAWHGLSQEFFQLAEADPNHLVDFAVIPASKLASARLLERERHGEALVLFDRGGHLAPPPLDWEEHLAKAAARLATMRSTVPLFAPMVEKAVRRGHLAEAAAFYQALVLKPLVELLRLRHCPERYDYGWRYLDRDIPPADRALIERLAFPADPPALLRGVEEATQRFVAEYAALDAGEWRLPSAAERAAR